MNARGGGAERHLEAELAGNKLPDGDLKEFHLTLESGKYIARNGSTVDRGTLQLDPTVQPKAMDITSTDGPNKGVTLLAIYEFSDDTLRVCYDLSGAERPKEFKTTPDSSLFLVTYRRDQR